jgi:hypothetical protein
MSELRQRGCQHCGHCCDRHQQPLFICRRGTRGPTLDRAQALHGGINSDSGHNELSEIEDFAHKVHAMSCFDARGPFPMLRYVSSLDNSQTNAASGDFAASSGFHASIYDHQSRTGHG